MKYILRKKLFIAIISSFTLILGKNPRGNKPPKPPKQPLSHEQKQSIVSSIAQIMGGICKIVENPHNPDNIGNSVSTMVDGLIKIAVTKISNKKIIINDMQKFEEHLNQLCEDISKEIAEVIITKKLYTRQF